jgi:hypothetical protein
MKRFWKAAFGGGKRLLTETISGKTINRIIYRKAVDRDVGPGLPQRAAEGN